MESGKGYRVDSPPENELITPELAGELRQVLECFAAQNSFHEGRPLTIGFRPGLIGHHRLGRAVDIYDIGGTSVDYWRRRWRAAHEGPPCDSGVSRQKRECASNLGWRLYKALQRHCCWAQPPGYPVQLFGPWTREEGPWKRISDRLLRAHRDHIHVAK